MVDLLVRGEYETVESMTDGRRLTAAQLERAVLQYGRTLAVPPDSAFASLDVVAVDGADPPEVRVLVPLWTVEEGESDLTLDLLLREDIPGAYDVEVDDLHVL
jgi:hypothetical protein